MKRLERLLSRFDPKSEISRVNEAAGAKPVKVSRETFELLSHAQDISRLSGGAFDITTGPLAALWDVSRALCAPAAAAISQAAGLVGFSSLTLDTCKGTAMLKLPGQIIDLGGVGKGYASDRAMAVFKHCGVASAYTNIGGNVSTLGAKPDGTPWQVGIRHPRAEGHLIGAVSCTGDAAVTSGDYERFFVDGAGKRCHHLMNPLTGYPAESDLCSATVIDKSAMLADALSTAVFVLGLDKGRALLDRFPAAGAVLVTQGLTVYVSGNLQNRFTPVPGIRTEALS